MLIDVLVTVLRNLIAAIVLALLCCAAVHVAQRGNTASTGSGPTSPGQHSPAVPPGTTYYR